MQKVLSLCFLLCCVGCSTTPPGSFKSGDFYFTSIRITSHGRDSSSGATDSNLRRDNGASSINLESDTIAAYQENE